MNYQLSRLRYFIYGHRFIVVTLVFVITIWGGSFITFSRNVDKSIRANEAAARAQEDEASKLLEELQSKREAEHKAAEEKRLQEESEEERARAEEPVTAAPISPAGSSVGSCNTSTSHNNPASIDVLVNKKHCLVPLSFVPNVVSAQGGATISSVALQDYNRMFNDAASAGQPFWVSSSYRSYATQVSTYNHWVSVNGQTVADTVSARPGYSEHQTGLAIDVAAGDRTLNKFAGTSQYQWFQANAANYGFIQRYYAGFEGVTGYASEEWHYRYVGVAVAKDMQARGVKTLEQYWGFEGGNYR